MLWRARPARHMPARSQVRRRRRTHRLTWNQGNTSTFSDGVSTTSNWLSRSDNSCRQLRVRSRSHLSCVTSLSRRRRTSTCTGEARTQPCSAPCWALTSKRRSWYRVPPRLAPHRSPSGRLSSWCLSANQPSLRIRARSRCNPTKPHTMSVSHGRVPVNWHRMPITRLGSCPRAPSHASMLRTPSTTARRTSTDGTVLIPAVPSKPALERHNLTCRSGVRRRNRVRTHQLLTEATMQQMRYRCLGADRGLAVWLVVMHWCVLRFRHQHLEYRCHRPTPLQR